MRVADYSCRAILRLFPKDVRNAHGAEMRHTFAEVCAAASGQGWSAMARTVLGELLAFAKAAVDIRRGEPRIPAGREPGRPRREGGLMTGWESDLRQAFRSVMARKATTGFAVVLLGLAIAACTTVFTVADAVIFNQVPYKDADRLVPVGISRRPGSWPSLDTPLPLIRAWRESGAFERVEAHYSVRGAIIDDGDEPRPTPSSWITPGTFDMLGVAPLVGRAFTLADTKEAVPPVLLSERIWQSQFGRRSDIVGQRISIDGQRAEVIGVMSKDFRYPFGRAGIWRPIDPETGHGTITRLAVVATLGAGMPREDARRLAESAAMRLDPKLVAAPASVRFAVALGLRSFDEYTVNIVKLLFAAVTLVLLVACVNVANLLLARALGRRRDRVVRAALGASRTRLIREALLESALIAAAAAVAGLALSWITVSSFDRLLPEYIIQRGANRMDIDGRALAMVIGVMAAVTLASGLLPAWLGTRATASGVLKEGDRGASEGRTARRLSTVLIVGEVAVAVALLVGAALMVRSFIELATAERGIETRGIVSIGVRLQMYEQPDVERRQVLASELQRRLETLPGVAHVMRVRSVPPETADIHFSTVETDAGAKVDGLEIFAFHVEPAFFEFFGVQLASGRFLSASDPPEAVVISQNLARSLWPDGSNPVGRTFRIGSNMTHQVVGVSRDVRTTLMDPRLDRPELFKPAKALGFGRFVLKLADGTAVPEEQIRAAIRSVHPKYIIDEVAALDDQYREQIEGPETAAMIATAFAAFGTFVCAAGLFSALTLSVARRRREFGIRLAVGAHPSQLSRLVARQTAVTLGAGLALGCAIAFVLTRSLSSVLAGVEANDAASWISVLVIVAVAGAAAAWLPVRDARRTDPLLLLREE